jgi:hypothetical protein
MTTVCEFRTGMDWSVGAIGVLAAVFWFIAAWQSGRQGFLETALAELDQGMRTQARLNAVAAFLTGLAALIQVALFYMPSCRDFG